MYLLIENNRTQLYGAREDQLDVLDRFLRYPTPMAGPVEKGLIPPEISGGWDGWAKCLHRPKTMLPWVPTGLLGYVRYYARCYGWQLTEDDRRRKPELDVPEVTAAISLRPYQRQAVDRAIERGRGVIDCPPRGGKTRIGAAIQRALNIKTIWIAPTHRIVAQTVEVLTGFFGRGYVAHQTGGKGLAEAAKAKVVCCTTATAASLPADFYQSRDCLIVDEFHHCFHPGTKVFTRTGWRGIQQVQVGDLVLTGEFRWRKVRRVWERKAPAQMYRVRAGDICLEVTSEHRIYTDRGKVRVRDLRIGDNLLRVRKGFFEAEHRGARGVVLGAGESATADMRSSEFNEQSRGASEGDGSAFEKCGVSEAVVRSDEGGSQPLQAPRGGGEDQAGLGRKLAGSLWSGSGGKGGGADEKRAGGCEVFGAVRVSGGVPDHDGGSGKVGSEVVPDGFRTSRSEDRGGNRRGEPQTPGGGGSLQECFFGSAGVGGSADSGQGLGKGAALVGVQVTGIESNPSGCLSVYDLEVEEDHNYFAEGVLVSNSASQSYHTIFGLCDHIYYRYGMTGTFFRSGSDDMAMHALLSETIFKIDSRQLQELGWLVPAHVVFLPVPCPHLRGVGSSTFQSGHGKLGIHEHDVRNQLVAWVAYYLVQLGRRVLILVGTKKQGYLLRDLLRQYLGAHESPGRYQPVEFVSTDTDRGRQKEILEAFERGEAVKVLIGTTLLGEGVDLPAADALVYARGEKAEVSLTQAMYRVVTAAGGKQAALVVDFADRHHRKLLEHADERLRVYFSEPLFSVQVLPDIRHFPGWLENVVPRAGK